MLESVIAEVPAIGSSARDEIRVFTVARQLQQQGISPSLIVKYRLFRERKR